MSLSYIDVIADLGDGQGNYLSQGTGFFAPTTTLTDAADHLIAGTEPQIPVVFQAGNVPPSVRLIAADDPSVVPGPGLWAWVFTPPSTSGVAAFSVQPAAGPVSFTATDASPCVFTTSATAYVNGSSVTLSGGSLPAGFSAATTYYVAGASGFTFQLAATPGGSPIASTSAGSGEVTTTSVYLSGLAPVSSGTTFSAYLPLPAGTPLAGQAPVADGSGEGSAWSFLAGLQPTGVLATDTANVQALLDLGVQNAPLAAGNFVLGQITPPPNTPCGLAGAGSGVTNLTWDTAGAAISFGANTGPQRFSLTGLNLTQNGTGDLLACGQSTGNRIPQITSYDVAYSLGSGNTGGSWINAQAPASSNGLANSWFERCTFSSASTTRTVPGISVSSAVAGGIAHNEWYKCDFNPADSQQPCVSITAGSSGGANNNYHADNALRSCRFEKPYGGAIRSISGRNFHVDDCYFWDLDVNGNPGMGGSLIYIGSTAGELVSAGTRVTGCGRNLGDPGGGGSTWWDVYLESTVAQTEISGYETAPGFHTSAAPAFFNFNGCPSVTIVNPQASGAADPAVYQVTNPAAQQFYQAGGILPVPNAATAPSGSPSGGGILYGAGGMPDWLGTDGKLRNLAQPPGWLPEDSGWLEWNFDPAVLLGSALAPSSGVVQAIRIEVRAVRSVTNVILYQAAAGTGLTTGENLAGLYLSSGTEVGITADQTTTWGSGFSVPKYQVMALTGGPYIVQPGFVDILVLSVESGGGTPTFGKAQNYATAAANPGTNSAAACRWGVSAGSQTALPSPSFTPSSYLTPSAPSFFGALS